MIINAVTAILLEDATMAGYVSDRIYPIISPQEVITPYVIVQSNSVSPSDVKDGVSPVDSEDFQVDVYAKTVHELQSISGRVRTLIDFYTGPKNGVTIKRIRFVNESTGTYVSEAEIFAMSQDYRGSIDRT